MSTAVLLPAEAAAPGSAPALRMLAAEARWVFRRPRTLITLGLFALIPVLIAIGVVVADRQGGGGLIGAVAGNGLVLPIAALTVSLSLLLPLAVAMAAADAIAGEATNGTLRGLLIAPVGRLRLVGVKAFGVLLVALAAAVVIALVGLVAGMIVVGSPDGGMITLSGTTLGFWAGFGRIALVVLWVVGQLAAVGAVALAVSSLTEHPLVVLASVLGGLITFGVLSVIPALDWLSPYLLTTGWSAGADALRDPIVLSGMGESTVRAACYLVVGVGVTIWRMRTRDA